MANETTLSSSWANISNMWSQSHFEVPSSPANFSMQNCFDVAGIQASIPDANSLVNPESNYSLSGSLRGLSHNLDDVNSGFFRRMISGSSIGDLCNTFFITDSDNYTITNYNPGINVLTKNGGTMTTLTTRGEQASISSLAEGDVIHGTMPFDISRTNTPGQQGAYGGYAGYCFATRRDRATVNFYLQNLDLKRKTDVQILFTSTSDSNVTSMTTAFTVSLDKASTSNGGFDNSFSVTTTGNYYILSNGPICVWRGQTPSSDCMPLYPLSSEHLYGFFSQDGHAFSVNNARVGRSNSGGGGEIKGRSSANTTATILTPNSGRDNTFTSDGVNATLKAGAFFSGHCCVVYDDDAISNDNGDTLFGAESQADGNGSEMTPFVGKKAFGRYTMTGATAIWNAFISHGHSGSAPSALGYADVIMRFNKSDVFQEAQGFSGNNTTAPHSSKAYFGNGSGTGTSANIGDYFLCNVEVQGYQDIDSGDKDETVMIMTNDFTLPTAHSHTLFADSISSGTPGTLEPYTSAANACAGMTEGAAQSATVFSPSSTIEQGVVLFWDDEFKFPVNMQGLFVGTGAGRSFSEFRGGYNGTVSEVPDAC